MLTGTGRPGSRDMAEYLANETDFFTAPASTHHHDAHEGGLVKHSLAVADEIERLAELYDWEFKTDSLRIVALLHDICKANLYTSKTRNVKNEQTGKWEHVPYYTIEDAFPAGHGEKSAILAVQFMPLTPDEVLAIRWHMAGWDAAAKDYAGAKALGAALQKYSLISLLHMADMAATYLK